MIIKYGDNYYETKTVKGPIPCDTGIFFTFNVFDSLSDFDVPVGWCPEGQDPNDHFLYLLFPNPINGGSNDAVKHLVTRFWNGVQTHLESNRVVDINSILSHSQNISVEIWKLAYGVTDYSRIVQFGPFVSLSSGY